MIWWYCFLFKNRWNMMEYFVALGSFCGYLYLIFGVEHFYHQTMNNVKKEWRDTNVTFNLDSIIQELMEHFSWNNKRKLDAQFSGRLQFFHCFCSLFSGINRNYGRGKHFWWFERSTGDGLCFNPVFLWKLQILESYTSRNTAVH